MTTPSKMSWKIGVLNGGTNMTFDMVEIVKKILGVESKERECL